MIKYFYSNRIATKLHQVKQPRKGTWVIASAPDQQELQTLQDLISIPGEDILEAIELFEVPRIRKTKKQTLLYLRTPSTIADGAITAADTILLAITTDHVVTITTKKNPFIQRFIRNTEITTTQRTKFLFEFIYELVDEYSEYILAVHHKVQRLMSEQTSVTTENIATLLNYEQIATIYQSSLKPLQKVIERLASGKVVSIFAEDEELLDDVTAELAQALDIVSVTLRLIVSLRDSYQILFSNTLNRNVQLLAGITIVLTVPTVVASLWGMNVSVPFANHPLAFFFVVAGAIALSLVIFYLLRKKRWV